MAKAKKAKLYTFDSKLVHRLQHIFINDHADLYHFSIVDIIRILEGFESIQDYFNRDKVLSVLTDLALDT